MAIEFTVFKGSAEGSVGEDYALRDLWDGTKHYKHADMVLGHEGVGTVEQIGEDVKGFKIGDVVGWGYIPKACRRVYGLANLDQGSFGSHAIWDASWLFHVQRDWRQKFAAPPHVRRRDVVFSSTDSKREEAMRLGATEFYATKGVEKLDIGKKLDHLLVTTSFLPSWNLFLSIMKPRGTVYPLTVSGTDLVLPAMPVVLGGLTVQGSVVASRSVPQEDVGFRGVAQHSSHHRAFPTDEERGGGRYGQAARREHEAVAVYKLGEKSIVYEHNNVVWRTPRGSQVIEQIADVATRISGIMACVS
ncbi:hypothetical protein C8J57DRAFT_1489369 [Mycena rebaudengoi]|nr:hypothetical protein C8J57DRAFT_1489369 [Mycena rebaudengoi]